VGQAAPLSIPTGNHRPEYGFYGYKCATMYPVAITAWGARTASQLKPVMACWAIDAGTDTQTYRMNGADLPSPYNTSPTRPIDVSKAVAIAIYYNGAQCVSTQQDYIALSSTQLGGL